MSKTKVLITGGHMTPALSVISELRSRGDYEFIWVGHKYNQFGNKNPSAEFNTVSKLDIRFINLTAGKLTRNWGGDNWIAGLLNFIKIPVGFIQSLLILLTNRPKIIISFGGYLALPIAIIGRFLGIKVVTHEQTAVTGLTNKIIPKFAHKIFISWPSSAKYYPKERTYLTGNPLRPEIFENNASKFEVKQNLPTIFITGGNQGSHKLNKAVFPALGNLLQISNIIHQTGNASSTGDYRKAQELSQKELSASAGEYIVRDFIYEQEIGSAFNKADLIIARAGANTVYEILALGKPAIFIPIPWVTHNEQFINAKVASDTGLATILEEKELSAESLSKLITVALSNDSKDLAFNGSSLAEAKSKAKAVIKEDAAKSIVDHIQEYL